MPAQIYLLAWRRMLRGLGGTESAVPFTRVGTTPPTWYPGVFFGTGPSISPILSCFVTGFSYWKPPWKHFFSYVQPSVTDHKWALLREGSEVPKRQNCARFYHDNPCAKEENRYCLATVSRNGSKLGQAKGSPKADEVGGGVGKGHRTGWKIMESYGNW